MFAFMCEETRVAGGILPGVPDIFTILITISHANIQLWIISSFIKQKNQSTAGSSVNSL